MAALTRPTILPISKLAGEKQSAKKVRLCILIFLLFYGFRGCLREYISSKFPNPFYFEKITSLGIGSTKTPAAASPHDADARRINYLSDD